MKFNFGKNNRGWQESSSYYNLYHNLPATLQHPRTYRGTVVFFLVFIAGAISLFTYDFVSGLKDTGAEANADYHIGVIVSPVFALLLAAAGFFIIRNEIKNRKQWKTYEGDFIKSEGRIIGRWGESTAQVDNIGGYDYYIAIQYDERWKVKAPVSQRRFDRLKINDRVKIRYVRTRSDVCELL
jgi:hypothetical protein